MTNNLISLLLAAAAVLALVGLITWFVRWRRQQRRPRKFDDTRPG